MGISAEVCASFRRNLRQPDRPISCYLLQMPVLQCSQKCMLIRTLHYRNLLWKQILPELWNGHKHNVPYSECRCRFKNRGCWKVTLLVLYSVPSPSVTEFQSAYLPPFLSDVETGAALVWNVSFFVCDIFSSAVTSSLSSMSQCPLIHSHKECNAIRAAP